MARKTARINLRTSIPFDDLARQLVDELNHPALLKLIKGIDEYVSEYEFTMKLRDHFVAEMKAEEAEHEPRHLG
jgi:hypothetical protein